MKNVVFQFVAGPAYDEAAASKRLGMGKAEAKALRQAFWASARKHQKEYGGRVRKPAK